MKRPADLWWSRVLAATLEGWAGRFDASERRAREAMMTGNKLGQADAAGMYFIQLFALRYQQGRLGELAPLLESRPQAADPVARAVQGALEALVLASIGERKEACVKLDALAVDDFVGIPRNKLWLALLALLAGTVELTRDSSHAASLMRLLLPHVEYNIVFSSGAAVFGSAHRWVGVLNGVIGEATSAQHHLRAAVSANRAIGADYWMTRAQLDLAYVLLEAGDPVRAVEGRHLLDDALGRARRENWTHLTSAAPMQCVSP